jgi:hypothetical protein
LIRRFVLLMLLAWLPIQAAAMPWLAFRCDQHDSGAQSSSQSHHHVSPAHHPASGDPDTPGHDSDAASDPHSCCHHFSGVLHTLPVMTGVAISETVVSGPPARLHDFIPDLLQRPPLAHLV